MSRILKFVPLILIFASVNATAADSFWDYIVGLSIKEVSLDVYEKGKTDPEGTLTEDFSLLPEFGAESGITYFGDTSWGYKYALNIAPFDMTEQDVDADNVDLDTSADGYFFYAMPVGVYDFHKHRAESSLLLGLGVGIGYLKAEGDVIFTEAEAQIKHDFAFSEFTYSFGLFLQYIIEGWSFSTSVAGPEVDDGDFEYNLFDFTLSVRKTIPF